MFERFLAPRTESVYALLRIVLGLLFAFHGMQGLTGFLIPKEYIAHFPTQAWFGSVIELVGGLLIAGGLFTRCAAFVCSGTMAVAYVQFHWRFDFGTKFFPVANQGEMALIYAFVFLYMACKGGGLASLDGLRKRRNP
jgi:putative oxidoreductase